MLDNVDLVDALEDTKVTVDGWINGWINKQINYHNTNQTKAEEVAEELRQGEATRKEIDTNRDAYRQASRRGTILYFVLRDLASINSMYQHSLTAYLAVSWGF